VSAAPKDLARIHVSGSSARRDGRWVVPEELDVKVTGGGGQELGTWLRKLTAEAAASLLEGIGQSSGAELADLSSRAAQAAVTALGELEG
jgi:hypothetical protein